MSSTRISLIFPSGSEISGKDNVLGMIDGKTTFLVSHMSTQSTPGKGKKSSTTDHYALHEKSVESKFLKGYTLQEGRKIRTTDDFKLAFPAKVRAKKDGDSAPLLSKIIRVPESGVTSVLSDYAIDKIVSELTNYNRYLVRLEDEEIKEEKAKGKDKEEKPRKHTILDIVAEIRALVRSKAPKDPRTKTASETKEPGVGVFTYTDSMGHTHRRPFEEVIVEQGRKALEKGKVVLYKPFTDADPSVRQFSMITLSDNDAKMKAQLSGYEQKQYNGVSFYQANPEKLIELTKEREKSQRDREIAKNRDKGGYYERTDKERVREKKQN